MTARRILFSLFLVALPLLQWGQATPPSLVNYQGVLRDSDGKPLSGDHDMTFRFYSASSGGDQILIDSHTAALGAPVSVAGGLFSVALGSGSVSDGSGPGTYTSLAEAFRDYGSVWLEIVVEAETLAPRVRVVAAAYALNSDNLDGLDSTAFMTSTTDNWVNTGGDSMTGKLTTAASASGGAGLTLPHGSAPSSPSNGDLWTTTGGLYSRINGATLGPFTTASGHTHSNLTQGTGIAAFTYNGGSAATVGLANTAVTAGTYGNLGAVGTFTVDAQGRLTAASSATIDHGSIAGLGDDDHTQYFNLAQSETVLGTATFSAATTDIRGQIVDGDSPSVTIGEPLYVAGGSIDLGAGANDDLTAADVTDLTDGGATTLHAHAFDSGSGDARYLRKDTADTAAGVITFAAASTDIRGQLVDGDSAYLTLADGLHISAGTVGIGAIPQDALGLYLLRNASTSGFMDGIRSEITNTYTGTTSSQLSAGNFLVSTQSSDQSVTALMAQASGAQDSTGQRIGLNAGATGGDGNLIGVHGFAADSQGTGAHYGVSANASGGAESYGAWGWADGATLNFGIYGVAQGTTTNFGVRGEAYGGTVNWGLFTSADAYIGGKLDFGAGPNDDLAAADVTDLTDGGTTTLHAHAFDTGSGDVRYLRKDTADTAAGSIVFAGGTTDIRGTLLDGNSTYLTLADDLYVSDGNVGIGTTPNDSVGLYYSKDTTASAELYGLWSSLVNRNTSAANYGLQAGYFRSETQSSDQDVIALFGHATGASGTAGWRIGVSGQAGGGNGGHIGIDGYAVDTAGSGPHYGVSGQAMGGSESTGLRGIASGATTNYGVYGSASGGTTNWGLYTAGNAYVGGKLDLGSGANDDLTASDVTDMTDGGTTTLHAHAFDSGSGDARYLRKDVDDTATGSITFAASATDIRGEIVNGNSTYVTIGEDAYVSGGHLGVGAAPTTLRALNGSLTSAGLSTIYGMNLSAVCTETGAGAPSVYGAYVEANHSGGTDNTSTVLGVEGYATGADASTGVHYGLYGLANGGDGTHYGVLGRANATGTGGIHYGVYGNASGGATNWGLYTPNDAYVGGDLGIGISPVYRLQLQTDSAAKPSTNTWTIASDERLKQDVRPFSDGLATLRGIKPIRYRYNGLAGTPKDAEGIGVLAQEIRDVAPYTVGTYRARLDENAESDTELYSFNSHALTFVMINAIKELDARIGGTAVASGPDGDAAVASPAPGLQDIQEPMTRIPTDGAVASAHPVREHRVLEEMAVAGATEPGDVLVIIPTNGEELYRCALPADSAVVGLSAGDIPSGDGDTARMAAVVLGGVTLCKVDAGQGPIRKGDLLVTSPTPGHAMRAPRPVEPGTVIGKALEPLAGGTGLIKVLVMLR